MNPGSMTLNDLLGSIRDGLLVIGLFVMVWKARGAIQPAIDFFKDAKDTMTRAREHMDIVEAGLSDLQNGMVTIMDNHLPHLQKGIDHIGKRHAHTSDVVYLAAPEEVADSVVVETAQEETSDKSMEL